ncbi:MAG: hypothetical protein ABW178_06645 [Pseudoxanthomonas sp.]
MKEKSGGRAAVRSLLQARKGILAISGAVCLAAWSAFLISMAIGAGTAAQIAVLSVALIVTEVGFWVASALLGMTVIQLRRKLLAKFLPRGRGDAA